MVLRKDNLHAVRKLVALKFQLRNLQGRELLIERLRWKRTEGHEKED